jgi:hypothetical protein
MNPLLPSRSLSSFDLWQLKEDPGFLRSHLVMIPSSSYQSNSATLNKTAFQESVLFWLSKKLNFFCLSHFWVVKERLTEPDCEGLPLFAGTYLPVCSLSAVVPSLSHLITLQVHLGQWSPAWAGTCWDWSNLWLCVDTNLCSYWGLLWDYLCDENLDPQEWGFPFSFTLCLFQIP